MQDIGLAAFSAIKTLETSPLGDWVSNSYNCSRVGFSDETHEPHITGPSIEGF